MHEAVDYVRAHNMITVPQVAAESLRMIMMTPERQLINPFFTAGAQILVSYPTDTMDYEARIQSMRGNNATAEVRRSFQTAAPLYQAAYLLGGLQIHGLRKELVDSGRLTERRFHDEIARSSRQQP